MMTARLEAAEGENDHRNLTIILHKKICGRDGIQTCNSWIYPQYRQHYEAWPYNKPTNNA